MSALPNITSPQHAEEDDSGNMVQPGWTLKTLKPKHKQVCQLLVQGIKRETIAAIVGVTPEYVTMLAKQPLVLGYMKDQCSAAEMQLDAMFSSSVTAIGEVLVAGNATEKLKAARLQMEATKRIGSGSGQIAPERESTSDRLLRLQERLLGLLEKSNRPGDNARVINEEGDVL